MSKYITVENFTKKRARKCMEEFEFMLDMCKCHGSPRSEIQEYEKKREMLKAYWKLRWNEDYHDRSEYGMYKALGPLVE